MEKKDNSYGKEIYCKRCGKPHGVLKYDKQVLEIGNVQIYNQVRYSCVCGYPKSFIPSPIEDICTKGFDGEARVILNGLGSKRKRAILGQAKENQENK